MTTFKNLYRVAGQLAEVKTGLCNFLPFRGFKIHKEMKWVRPDKKRLYRPSFTGDLEPMPPISDTLTSPEFQHADALINADGKLKKVFSLAHSLPKSTLQIYTTNLVNRVKAHAYDDSSPEVKIATLTAKVRYHQALLQEGKGVREMKVKTLRIAEKRNKLLKLLRKSDYKKFEWILDKLNIEYKPVPTVDRQVTRKKSLTLLVKLQVEKQKEAKLAILRKELDEQKIPFLEKKLEKLRWIKEQEEKNNLTRTVTDEDIESCVKQLEKVKIEVADRMKRGYVRKIHPYFLEPYDEDLLVEKEQQHCRPKKSEEKV